MVIEGRPKVQNMHDVRTFLSNVKRLVGYGTSSVCVSIYLNIAKPADKLIGNRSVLSSYY